MEIASVADRDLNSFGYTPKLSRTLGMWQIASFGLTYLQPMGPAVVFGFLLTATNGTVALPYLFAFLGMILTVLSYSILIKEYPLTGSIYSYAKIIIGPFFGYMAGWLLALDYILIPSITSASSAFYAHKLIPTIPYEIWLVMFVFSMGFINLIGIKSSTVFGSIMLLIQILVVILGFTVWINFIYHSNHSIGSLFSTKPFHFDSLSNVIQASSLAIFSFLGFDSVTTLAEESVNPRKDIPKAMFLCTVIGFCIMFITGYLGVLALPNWNSYATNSEWINDALFELAQTAGGDHFALIYMVGFILAMVICNLAGTTAATRLLYGMGRDNVIPQRIFGEVNKRWKTPHKNILFIMIVELTLGSLLSIDQIAELINYGAITGFIILNFCIVCLGHKILKKKITLRYFELNEQNKNAFILKFFVAPLIALTIMGAIFVSLKLVTLIFGTIWAIFGVLYFYTKNNKNY